MKCLRGKITYMYICLQGFQTDIFQAEFSDHIPGWDNPDARTNTREVFGILRESHTISVSEIQRKPSISLKAKEYADHFCHFDS